MKRLNPEKLHVEYRDGVYPSFPIIPRIYTLTHSDETAELFLTIDDQIAYDKINPTRDEVSGEWTPMGADDVYLHVDVLVDDSGNPASATVRNEIFRRELPLALEAIRYGDRTIFMTYPYLDKAPILVHFNSSYTPLNRMEFWGTPSDYV